MRISESIPALIITTATILIIVIIAGIFAPVSTNKPKELRENNRIECVGGYKFIHGFNGSYTQILDGAGKGISCQ